MPNGASEAIIALTTEPVATPRPCSWYPCPSAGSGPQVPPMNGTLAPTTLYAPARISSWSPREPSVSSMRTRCGASLSSSARHSATAAPAARWPPSWAGADAVQTAKPEPPKTVTATPEPSSPSDAMTDCAEQPISGTPGKTSSTPASTAAGSGCPQLNTTTRAASSPDRARIAASRPAPRGSASVHRPTASHRRPVSIRLVFVTVAHSSRMSFQPRGNLCHLRRSGRLIKLSLGWLCDDAVAAGPRVVRFHEPDLGHALTAATRWLQA